MTGFDQIYRAYFEDVYRYARRLTQGNEGLAEEITSQTFFKALGAIDGFRGDCDIRVWLCQIAKNCYLSHRKEVGRGVPLEDEDLDRIPDPEESLEERLIHQTEAEGLMTLVHKLEEPYREIFLWRVFGGLSFRKIGGLFGKSDNWACVVYHRARAMIQKQMKEERL